MTQDDRLLAPLDRSVIETYCRAAQCNIELHVLRTVESTNTWLLDGEFDSAVTLCAAEHQTLGRGRRGKSWHSPDSGVTFSLRFNCPEPIVFFNGLSLLVGSELCDCLRAAGVSNAMVKWPNDVLVNGAKLAGILIESRAAVSLSDATATGSIIVIGIGINYRRGAETQLIEQASTDLVELCGADQLPDRSTLIASVATRLTALLSSDVPAKLAGLATRWGDYDALSDTHIVVSVAGQSETGLATGIDAEGGLQVQTDDGLRVFMSADVSVRRG